MTYPNKYLDVLKDEIHKSIAKKYVPRLTRQHYEIEFEEKSKNNVEYKSGKKLTIILGCSALDLKQVKYLATSAFKMPKLWELLRYPALIKRSDAVTLYGIKLDGVGNPIVNTKHRFRRYQTKIETFVTVTLYDPESKKTVTVTQKNGNAFDAQNEAEKLLYGE